MDGFSGTVPFTPSRLMRQQLAGIIPSSFALLGADYSLLIL